MCGIFGVVCGPESKNIDRELVAASADQMQHRGPDACGLWEDAGHAALAHRRLAIIDLDSANNQPFISSCGRYVLTFNGEIYNYIELRRELEQQGQVFRTTGDTEVLLAAYQRWGDRCVERFNGDWAFAIYDREQRSLFASRDRFGVKPFNYTDSGGQFVFASEVKAIVHYLPRLRRPNHNVIANYCRNGLGAQGEETWFAGVKRLPPAHNLFWYDGKLRIARYWQYPTDTMASISLDAAIQEYRDLFVDAVKLRLRSDVPVGTTLSSGLDSGSIVSVVRKLYDGPHHTFTATFSSSDFVRGEKAVYRKDVKVDEAAVVRDVASQLGLTSHLINCDSADFVPQLSRVIRHLESGHSSPSTIPLSRILDVARRHVTVLLEGQGADELLAGYVLNMFPLLIYELVRRGQIGNALREYRAYVQHYSLAYTAKVFVRLLNNDWIERRYHRASGVQKVFGPLLREYSRIQDYPDSLPPFGDRFTGMLGRAHAGGLVNLLHYGDSISMASSLESRLPFTDVRLVEFAFRLPFHLKMRHGLGKYIHRRAMDGIAPDIVTRNPLKFGFNSPLAMHFAADTPASSLLLSDRCLSRGTFNEDGLRSALRDQRSGSRDNSTFLFRCLSAELWWRWFMDEDGEE